MNISNKLMPYIALADMIADSFGKKCEIVIHDLATPESSVVYVVNGIVTNREVGQSFDHLVKQVLLSKNFKNDYCANYTFKTQNEKEIKSSTSLIRDENDAVIGAFCINFEMENFKKMQTFRDDLDIESNYNSKDESINQTSQFNNVIEIIDNLIDNTIGDIDVKLLKKTDNIRLITFMNDKGIFLTKGSVDKVAEKLKISPVTVYSYLDEIKKKSKNNT